MSAGNVDTPERFWKSFGTADNRTADRRMSPLNPDTGEHQC